MSLTPERLLAMRTLWEAALEQPQALRRAYLLSVAPDDAELRTAVTELLDAHDDASDPFAGAFPASFPRETSTPDAQFTGKLLGAYRVTREIGHGGMGTVYEAERADDQFVKRVAVKTLRYGRGSAEMLERFARERKIQAGLAHPNIAMLLDAGVTDDQVPFIVLEYIDGTPIDEYCQTRRLALQARLDLFRQVIQAVQHAHRQLVVHRDLKPSNILVTNSGVVKLLDFGISKILDESAELTETVGPRAFTIAYASPEQVRGEPITTSTDVYSLGVVLYRLLTGALPFDIDQSTTSAALNAICLQDPSPPSATATTAAAESMGLGSATRLREALHGELDAIVTMALRKEPERRYATADAMGEDLLNHLRNRPVQARPDSVGYRVRKLVQRNRAATAAMLLAFVAMAAGTSIALWQARSARQSSAVAEAQRRIAVQERRSAERVSVFMQQMLSAGDRSWAGKSPGPGTTMVEVVDAAADRVDVDLAGEPAVAEALHRVLQSAYTALHQTAKGERHARRVLELMRARNASGTEIARGLHDLGALYYLGGKRDSSLALVQESYALFKAAQFPETEDLTLTLNQLGLTLQELGRPAEAEPYLVRALRVRRKVLGDDVVAAIISSNLGLIREGRGDLDGAEAYHREAEGIYARLAPREYFEHGGNLNNLGNVLLLKGDLSEAERTIRRSLDILAEILGPEHVNVGAVQLKLALIQLASGTPGDALQTVRSARERLGKLPAGHSYLSRADTYEARILLALGRTTEAEQRARVALAARVKAHPATDARVAETEGVLGRIRIARGATAEGLVLLARSHANLERSYGAEDPRTREIATAIDVSAGGAGRTH